MVKLVKVNLALYFQSRRRVLIQKNEKNDRLKNANTMLTRFERQAYPIHLHGNQVSSDMAYHVIRLSVRLELMDRLCYLISLSALNNRILFMINNKKPFLSIKTYSMVVYFCYGWKDNAIFSGHLVAVAPAQDGGVC